MQAWLTNAVRIREEVIRPFEEVLWQVFGWNGQTVLYGDERALFIFDTKEMNLYAFFDHTYLCHRIVGIYEQQEENLVDFHIAMADMSMVRATTTLNPKERTKMRQLASGCLNSTRWLKNHKVK